MQNIVNDILAFGDYLDELEKQMPKAYPVEMARWMFDPHSHYSGQITQIQSIATFLAGLDPEPIGEAAITAHGRAVRSAARMLFALQQIEEIDGSVTSEDDKIAEGMVAVGGYSTDFTSLSRSLMALTFAINDLVAPAAS